MIENEIYICGHKDDRHSAFGVRRSAQVKKSNIRLKRIRKTIWHTIERKLEEI